MPTRILLVDDHALIREGLRRAFAQREGVEVVGEAAGVDEARALERALEPDVVVVDVNLGDGNGIDLVRELRAARPQVGLVVLTMYDGDEHLLGAAEAGASAFVLKSAPVEEVITAALRAAAAPATFSADGLAAAMRRRMARPVVQLTPREQEILELLASGLSVAQVSARLYVSASTTKTHMAKVYEKLGATNRTQAVMAAVRLGLVDADTVDA